MEGVFVSVCSYGERCLPCGVVGISDPHKWTGVYCLGGMILGNEIQINRFHQTLQLCGVEIFGDLRG